MNSSFLFLGQNALALIAVAHFVLLVIQFGVPRDTPRVLGYLYFFAMSAMLVFDTLSLWGIPVAIWYQPIFSVCLGVMALSLPSFVWFGLLEQPTQLQRKVLWRLPIVGALIGHAFGEIIGASLFIAGIVVSSILIFMSYRSQKYVARLMLLKLLLLVVYSVFLTQGFFWITQLSFMIWIFLSYRMVSAFLIKNVLSPFVPQLKEEAR